MRVCAELIGQALRITTDDKSERPYLLDGCAVWLYPEDVTKAQQKQRPTIGDQVRIIQTNTPLIPFVAEREATLTKIGTVVEVDKSDMPFKICVDGEKFWYCEDWVELEEALAYRITIDRGDGAALGVIVDDRDGVSLLIPDIGEDLLGTWNDSNLDQKVKPGDCMIEVNGFRDDLVTMVEECKKNTELNVMAVTEKLPKA
jgi:hypothetical protein